MWRALAQTPSPGTPGEGGGEGDFENQVLGTGDSRHLVLPITLTLPSPGVPGEGSCRTRAIARGGHAGGAGETDADLYPSYLLRYPPPGVNPGHRGAAVQIDELSRSKSGISRFLKVPYGIYSGDPNWVAPLLADLTTVFTDRNPLFQHAEMGLWVARRDGRDVGRIAGIIDRNHNEFHHESTAFFGFFEAEDDAAGAKDLFDTGSAWARAKGMNRLLGPMNPTTNDECGLLVDG